MATKKSAKKVAKVVKPVAKDLGKPVKSTKPAPTPPPPPPRAPKKDAPAPVSAAKPAKASKSAKPAPAPAPPPRQPSQKPPQPPVSEATYTWHGLQDALRAVDTLEGVEKIFKAELAGEARLRWLLRIQGRRQILRNEAELEEIHRLARA